MRKVLGTPAEGRAQSRPVCSKCKSSAGVFKLHGLWVCECLQVQKTTGGDPVPVRAVFPNRRARRAARAMH